MTALSPELQKLEERAKRHKPIPNRTVRLSRPTVKGGSVYDAVAQISKVAVSETPTGNHTFELTLPDKTDFRGAIEVDDTQEEAARLRIIAEGIFEDPDVLRPIVRVALEEAGVEQAIVELGPQSTNLSPSILRQAGSMAFEPPTVTGGEQLIAFSAIPTSELPRLAAAA